MPEPLLALDRAHVWHPYSTLVDPPSVFAVESASGVRLRLADGRELIDGMASWWSVIHGYNHPGLNAAVRAQLERMAHVMFGGLTHAPAVALAAQLVAITPAPLDAVFFADSGSVSVEVAIKMAIQYWAARGKPGKQRLLTVRGGYHGDTFAAMSVCDPVTGMHRLFQQTLAQQFFAPRPAIRYGARWDESDIAELARLLEVHREEIAAVILEPVVQGAGGMWFYAPEYLRRVRELCDAHGVLLILDEIATGFGRTGRLFACEHAGIAPDLMCLGKALTGGYMTLAATLATREVAETISRGDPGVFMHGPTFMANPLACAAALASVELLLGGPWAERIAALEQALETGLAPARALQQVVDVRCLGGIGVIELAMPVDMRIAPRAFVERGVWVRPFGRLVYVMPAYVMAPADVAALTAAMCEVVATF
ncbi:MAG: adenosylmethionine--8-amino-7-oxononanoate transaminase [Gammaproteobacteria bacterium]|nr:adenosylmethionine--8-amino-7-oxononanoate transaminase [Gammaproteobacteria bacterium]MBI5616122.1 adenosylmethionine--8-amino-7-oxononanoate transaminase [Gammaproteobacteria bacterium]